MYNNTCEENNCKQSTVAKCMHCNNHLCLKCLTQHQQPFDNQISQLTNDMNKLLSLSSVNENDKQMNNLQITLNQQYELMIEQIDTWEVTMNKQLKDYISNIRQSLRNSFEQISFEIEEWSTEREIKFEELARDIEKLANKTDDETDLRIKIDKYNRQIEKYVKEYDCTNVEFNFLNYEPISIPPATIQLFNLFENSLDFDLSLIRDPANACFDASGSSLSVSSLSSTLSPSNSLTNRREKIFLPSVLLSSKYHIIFFSNKSRQLSIFSRNGTLIDQFTWNHNDIVDITYDKSTSTANLDSYFVLSANGSVYYLEYHIGQHSYTWSKLIAVNNQTYYTQLIYDSNLSYLYLFMSSKRRLDQWTIHKNKRNLIYCLNQFIVTNDHVEHICSSDEQIALLLRDKVKSCSYRIELRYLNDLLVTIRSIKLDRLSKPIKLIHDNRQGFILCNGNQLCSFGHDNELTSKRIFQDVNEIKRACFCQRSTFVILTENEQLLFYVLSK